MLDVLALEQWLAVGLLPFVRIGAALTAMTVMGTRVVPARVRAILALAITVLVAPQLQGYGMVVTFSLDTIRQVAQELVIGLAIGFATRLLFETFVVGAQMIAMQTGLGFASLVDPGNGVQVPVLGQFFLMLTTLIFLGLDGHLVVLRIVAESFWALPADGRGLNADVLMALALFGRWLFAGAVLVALSAALSLLVVNVTFGVMTRAAPQLNIFSVGFPVTMVAGLMIVWLTMGGFEGHVERQLSRTTALICQMVQLECR
jgi:flagellar biosynthetic protein FliR